MEIIAFCSVHTHQEYSETSKDRTSGGDGYVSDTQDSIPSQDNNQLGGKILAVWERYKPLLENDYSRAGYMISVDVKKYVHERVSVLYIYVNYHVIFLQFIIIKII